MKPTIISILLVLVALSCVPTKQPATNLLLGKWDNKSGQVLEFKANDKAYWVFYKESNRDTFEIRYRTDFSKQPKEIDLTGFKVGPLKGKTLYGIIEFTNNNTIRLDFEPVQENRPKDFDTIQTQTYFKIK